MRTILRIQLNQTLDAHAAKSCVECVVREHARSTGPVACGGVPSAFTIRVILLVIARAVRAVVQSRWVDPMSLVLALIEAHAAAVISITAGVEVVRAGHAEEVGDDAHGGGVLETGRGTIGRSEASYPNGDHDVVQLGVVLRVFLFWIFFDPFMGKSRPPFILVWGHARYY